MRRFVLALVFAVTASAVGAGAARADASQLAATDRAEASAAQGERRVVDLAQRRAKLAAQYEDELRGIDKLKKQRASWRRDREIQESMSVSVETAKQLGAATRELAAAQTELATARRALLAAVEAERPTATGGRAQKLDKLVATIAPARSRAHKIKLPSGEIDPLADPEELDEQAQQLRDSETELQRQVTALESQARELDRVATLRKQHERAGELSSRDDDAPHRGVQRPTSRGTKETTGFDDSSAPAPQNGGPTPPTEPTAAGDGTPYESDASVVLSDVVDASTIDKLQKAQRSGDPAVRAAAAKQARDAVASRLARLKLQRAQVEARAQQLRGKR
ncbi:MAG: hypothetical protein NT062_33115 [Proteobacteria bacterium]|nr:hypothetical protein [Pseudomonadota bacterium]